MTARRSFTMEARGAKRNRTALTNIYLIQGPDGRWVRTKRIPALAPLLPRAAVQASATQSRVLAEESRELLLDRVFAGKPTPTTGRYPPKEAVERPAATSTTWSA